MNSGEASERWQIFLTKIEERFELLMSQGESGCSLLLDLNHLDPIPMTNAWTALEAQVHDLINKVNATWQEKVEPALASADAGAIEIEREQKKGDDLVRRIVRARDRHQIAIFANAGRRIFERAKELLSRDYRCTQCQAALPVSNQFFRSVHLSCPYCRRVNTFNPGVEIRAVETFCCHHLSQHATMDLWFAWLDAEAASAGTSAAEHALLAYVREYLENRIAIVPEYRASFEADLIGRTAFFAKGR